MTDDTLGQVPDASVLCGSDVTGDSAASTPAVGGIQEVAPGVFAWQTADSLSPSLRQDHEAASYEMKFLLQEDQARVISDWALSHLQQDPHGDPELGHAYRIHSLYFDTPELDVMRKSPGYKRKKYRLRRYGDESLIYLEQKKKSGDRVAKRRVGVPDPEIERLLSPEIDPQWVGHWFQHRLTRRRLRPTCRISYERQAFFGQTVDGPLRLTLDRNVRCRPATDWTVGDIDGGHVLLTEAVLLELKFRSHLPALYKALIQDLGLASKPLSKYRLAVPACGLDNQAGRGTNA